MQHQGTKDTSSPCKSVLIGTEHSPKSKGPHAGVTGTKMWWQHQPHTNTQWLPGKHASVAMATYCTQAGGARVTVICHYGNLYLMTLSSSDIVMCSYLVEKEYVQSCKKKEYEYDIDMP